MKRRHLLAAAASSLVAAPAIVSAQGGAWPSRGPIKLVAQFPPGGLVDVVSRLIAPHLSQALGQNVVVENRPGAGGLIGTDWVSKQPADGYTLLVSHAAVHIYAAVTRRTLPFDPVGDFTHMGLLCEAPMVLVVKADSPFKTLEQYVVAARTRPVRYGTSGIGSANHLFGELLKIEGKAPNLDHVPYQGSAPAMQDLNGGQIESVFDPITTNVATLKAGTLRALAVSTPKRLAALPNIPTFAEQGYPKLTGSQWLGLSAPKGLPAPIAQRLTALIPEVLVKADVAARLEELQTLPRNPTLLGEDFVRLIRDQMDEWRTVARAANVEVIG
ncbi:MAG: tripartite tricarboxylate transporter substrate binding protein [Burkholderiaceae bacterium]|jgi:tripartite-type tricarboxylate transporter receptor subunit TctC|nr:tripartite tricarboxylate transporter substrate binding protein [Burkholderiaceae bacterium]